MLKIIYVADPMCSWCWGFAPELSKLREYLKDKAEFSLLLGGLRDGHAWDDAFREFLHGHWEQVHLKTGQPFSTGLLEKSSFNYTTEPACRALCILRQLAPDRIFELFEAFQRAFYREGVDITDEENMIRIIRKAGIRREEFSRLFHADTSKEAAESDRFKTRAYGASVFPSLAIIDEEGHLSVIRGYRTFEELKRLLQV